MGAGEVEISAFEIHRAIHLANPELLGALVSPFGVPRQNQAVLHTHMPYTTALCCIDKSNLPGSPVALSLRTRPNGQRVQMCSQNALRRSVGRQFHGAKQGAAQVSGKKSRRMTSTRAWCRIPMRAPASLRPWPRA